MSLIKDKYALEWQVVRDYTRRRITELRDELENPALGAEETAMIRGQLIFAREIESLDQDEKREEVIDPEYFPPSEPM